MESIVMQRKVNINRLILRIVSSLALIIYILFLIDEGIPLKNSTFEQLSAFTLFAIFLIGYYFLWKNEIISGLIFILWHIFQWCLVEWIWSDGALTLIMGIPIVIIGILILINGLKKQNPKALQFKHISKLTNRIILSGVVGISAWLMILLIEFVFIIVDIDIPLWDPIDNLYWLQFLIFLPVLTFILLSLISYKKKDNDLTIVN
ncbi:DUF7670 domain-containing protein [Maribellus mangrovi]|uniref:DUF7670 domain-containing protein n=1 Tax=Maribellus mangrovi TaxID=3133146 RepID=UPI0030EDD560